MRSQLKHCALFLLSELRGLRYALGFSTHIPEELGGRGEEKWLLCIPLYLGHSKDQIHSVATDLTEEY